MAFFWLHLKKKALVFNLRGFENLKKSPGAKPEKNKIPGAFDQKMQSFFTFFFQGGKTSEKRPLFQRVFECPVMS